MLEQARCRYNEHVKLSAQLAAQFDTTIAKRVGELSTAAKAFKAWELASSVSSRPFNWFYLSSRLQKSLSELQQILGDPSMDSELRSIANEELQSTSKSLDQLTIDLQASLVPTHPFDSLPCLLEIRPGAGGSEAALFVGDLMRMYQAFCKRYKLRASVLKLEDAPATGGSSDRRIQEVVLEIETEGAYALLRCEAGVHRVQRVPATETNGRTHTSAAAVMVLPTFPNDAHEEFGADSFDDPSSDFYVDPKDVKCETYRSQGAGGQHVNTTDSAVRLTHVPTNTVVAMQEFRSQPKNREKAWQLLRSRLAQVRREAREEERAQLRKGVIGVARMGRGDKIRTYNWAQQRVTDHRSGITLHHLDNILEGGESLDRIMESVKDWLKERDLESFLADEVSINKQKGK